MNANDHTGINGEDTNELVCSIAEYFDEKVLCFNKRANTNNE